MHRPRINNFLDWCSSDTLMGSLSLIFLLVLIFIYLVRFIARLPVLAGQHSTVLDPLHSLSRSRWCFYFPCRLPSSPIRSDVTFDCCLDGVNVALSSPSSPVTKVIPLPVLPLDIVAFLQWKVNISSLPLDSPYEIMICRGVCGSLVQIRSGGGSIVLWIIRQKWGSGLRPTLRISTLVSKNPYRFYSITHTLLPMSMLFGALLSALGRSSNELSIEAIVGPQVVGQTRRLGRRWL